MFAVQSIKSLEIFMGDFAALWSCGVFTANAKKELASILDFARTSDLREHLLRNQSGLFTDAQLQKMCIVINLKRLQQMVRTCRYQFIYSDNRYAGDQSEEHILGIMNFLRLHVDEDGTIVLEKVYKGVPLEKNTLNKSALGEN